MIRFKSKRNTVYLNDNMVIKEYEQCSSALFEKEYLENLIKEDVMVPKVLCIRDNVLFLEYIQGITVLEFIEDSSGFTRCEEVAIGITEWFKDFYCAVDHDNTKEIRGDVNGRNFIITKKDVYGVDFEERVFGEISTDFGRFLAYLSTYDLLDTTLRDELHKQLLSLFTKTFKIDSNIILDEQKREMKEMEERRKSRISD